MNSDVNFRRIASMPAFDIPELRGEKSAHLTCAQIADHEDHGAGEVGLSVIAQGEYCLTKDASSRFPQCVACVLNLVEKDEAELHGFGVILVGDFLAQ